MPAEPKVIVPGFDLASATNSASVFAGSEGLMTSTVGKVASAVTGVKSLSV